MECEKSVLKQLAQQGLVNVPKYEGDQASLCGKFTVFVVSPLGEESRIVLNDWGSSCKINVRAPWVGTHGYSEEADEDGYHTPSAVSDLKALLRSVYSMMTQEVPPNHTDNRVINKFWEERWSASTYWGTCLAHVNAINYNELASIFGQLK